MKIETVEQAVAAIESAGYKVEFNAPLAVCHPDSKQHRHRQPTRDLNGNG